MSASPPGSPISSAAPRPGSRRPCRDRRRAGDSARRPHLPPGRPRRPHRTARRRRLRHPRLQDRARRRPTSRCRSASSPQLTLEGAMLRRRRICAASPDRPLARRARLCEAQGRRAGRRRTRRRRSRGQSRRRRPTRRSRGSPTLVTPFRGRSDALSLARALDVDASLRRPTTTSPASRNGRWPAASRRASR